ncbi:terminase large subunit domain-containing protein [Roseimaritima ulvae]|nr:terminase large subunit [Roseimaritima ulvae]
MIASVADADMPLSPVLAAAYEVDWYYPPDANELFAFAKGSKRIKAAIDQGWADWIHSPQDVEAVKRGYYYDLSRDHDGRPLYWMAGRWLRFAGGEWEEVDEEEVAHAGRGDHTVRFIEKFICHTMDPWTGDPFLLLPWQRIRVQELFGWRSLHSGYRRYRQAYWEIAKKQGKTTLLGAIAVYLLCADRERKARILGAAADRKQASMVFDEARDFVKAQAVLAEEEEIECIESKKRLIHWRSGSLYEVISSDAFRSEGQNAHAIIFDELHVQRNRKMMRVLRRAGRARRQPIRIVITTAGETMKSIWGEERSKAMLVAKNERIRVRDQVMIASAEPFHVSVEQLKKEKANRIVVPALFSPLPAGEKVKFVDPKNPKKTYEVELSEYAKRGQRFIATKSNLEIPVGAKAQVLTDWTTDHAIRIANPSLGSTCQMEELQDDRENALDNPEEEAEYKQLTLNIVSGSTKDRWITHAEWNRYESKFSWRDLLERECYAGLDISFTSDLTALWLAFPSWNPSKGERYHKSSVAPRIDLLGLAWVADEMFEKREERENVPYRRLSKLSNFGEFGFCRCFESRAIQYDTVGEDILKIAKMFKILSLAYDPAYSQFLVMPYLDPGGLECIPHRQGALSMGPPTKRLVELLHNGELRHGGNPLLDAAIEGAVLAKPDRVGNRYPVKDASTSRIDPVVAMLMSVSLATDPPTSVTANAAWTGAAGSGVYG